MWIYVVVSSLSILSFLFWLFDQVCFHDSWLDFAFLAFVLANMLPNITIPREISRERLLFSLGFIILPFNAPSLLALLFLIHTVSFS